MRHFMNSKLHHLSLFSNDLERSLRLFTGLLGYTELWRAGPLGGKDMAALFGMESISAELVMLRGPDQGLLELINLREPVLEQPARAPVLPAPISLCLEVEDLDGLHQRLRQEGWQPFTPATLMPTPTGELTRIFCIKTEENVLLEFVEAASS